MVSELSTLANAIIMVFNEIIFFVSSASYILAILMACANTGTHLENARIYYESHEYEKALIELKKEEDTSDASNNGQAQTYKMLAMIYVAKQQQDDAIKAFQVALQYDPALRIESKYQSQEAIEAFNAAKSKTMKLENKKAENNSSTGFFDALRKALYHIVKTLFR